MKTETAQRDGIGVLKLSGRVATADVETLLAELTALRAAPGARVVIDMSELDNLPSTVIGGLLQTIRELEASGGRLALAAPDAGVRVVLDRLGVASMVTSAATVEDAVKLLKAKQP